MLQATDRWRKMFTMLLETGHSGITFKDACQVDSRPQHAGVMPPAIYTQNSRATPATRKLIGPCFGNLSVKFNLSGEFALITHALTQDLKHLGLWDKVRERNLTHVDGFLSLIDRLPPSLKTVHAIAFEIEPR